MNVLDKIKNRGKSIKFEQIAVEWLETKRMTIKQSTYYKYAYCIDKYLKNELGKLKRRKLEKYNYNELTNKLTKELSSKTVKEILNVLKSILKYANQRYEMNIKIDLIISPKVYNKEISVLSKREVNKLEKYCVNENDFKSLGIFICLNTGMRIGEICALKWEDIDFDKRLINVRKTLQRIYTVNRKTEVIIDRTKTESSIREIPMSDKVYHVLKEVSKKQDKESFFF